MLLFGFPFSPSSSQFGYFGVKLGMMGTRTRGNIDYEEELHSFGARDQTTRKTKRQTAVFEILLILL